jgi:cellulose synthase (UDP-forming)
VQLGLWLFDLDKEKRSLWNRLWGSEGTWRWGYTSLFRLIFLTIPIIYWLTGVPPFDASTSDVLVFALPVMLLQRAFIAWMSRGTQLPLIYEASSLLANFVVVRAFFKGLLQRRSHRFVVTDKGKSSDSLVIHWGTLSWFIGYAALLLFSVVYAHYAPDGSARDGGFQGVNLMWSVINLLLVAIAAAPCFEEPRRRAEERYPTTERAALRHLADGEAFTDVQLCDLSVSGCRLKTNTPLFVGQLVQVKLSGLEPTEARVARRARVSRGSPAFEWGLAFHHTDEQRRALTARIFCSADYIVPQEEGSVVLTARALLQTAFR